MSDSEHPVAPGADDWLDGFLEPHTRPAPAPPPEDIPAEKVEDDPRFRLLDVLRGRQKKPTTPVEPECAHSRTVPVHAQPYGELVAMLCLDCDEQLPVPEPEGDEEPDTKPAAPADGQAPGKQGPAGGKGRRGGRVPASKRPRNRRAAPVGRSYVRPIAFTLSAGLFGYSVGLVDALGAFLPAADHGATGTVGTFCSLAAGYGAWRVLGVPGVAGIVPFGLAGRALVTAVVATVAPGLAPDLVQLLDQYGVYIGLDASGTALLATAGAMCGGLYWLVDRRFRAMPWPVRWLVRIPLASAALAVALYGPGPR